MDNGSNVNVIFFPKPLSNISFRSCHIIELLLFPSSSIELIQLGDPDIQLLRIIFLRLTFFVSTIPKEQRKKIESRVGERRSNGPLKQGFLMRINKYNIFSMDP